MNWSLSKCDGLFRSPCLVYLSLVVFLVMYCTSWSVDSDSVVNILNLTQLRQLGRIDGVTFLV